MQTTTFRMTADARVRVTYGDLTGWLGTVEKVMGDGLAGYVRLDKDVPISMRHSLRDKRLVFLTADQVGEA